MIQEEHQQNNILLSSNYPHSDRKISPPSSSSSSEASANIDDDENEMDCDVHHHHHHHSEQPLFLSSHYHSQSPSFYCNTSPLITQHLPIPTTTSSYVP